MTLPVFTYGSLIDEPEHPARIQRRLQAAWPDHRRAFHLRSRYRGCTHADARFPELRVAGFDDTVQRDSLVLGTAPAAGSLLRGAWIEWADPDGATLAALDRREGYDPTNPEGSPYLRVWTEVWIDSTAVGGWVYITNPRHPRVVDLDLATQAQVLLAASPGRLIGRPRGAQYLLPLVRYLRRADMVDEGLEALVEAMADLVGSVEGYPELWLGSGRVDLA